jgi:hypothetical protein
MERRPYPRIRRRLAVRMNVSGRDTVRFTANISLRGLYILGAVPRLPNGETDLEVDLPGFGLVRMRARLVWGRRVPPGLESVARSGFGLQVLEAGAAWYAWCRQLEARQSGRSAPPPLPRTEPAAAAPPTVGAAEGQGQGQGVPVEATPGPSRRPGERLFPKAPAPQAGRPSPPPRSIGPR